MPSNRHLDDDSEFDRLLGQARWPDPQGEPIARLSDHWEAIVRRRRRHLTYGICGTLAAAASILLVVGFLASRESNTSPQANVVADRAAVRQSQRPLPSPTPDAISTAAPTEPAGWSIQTRDANVYEQVVLMSASSPREPSRRRSARSQPSRSRPDQSKLVQSEVEKSPLEELIVALASDPKADVDDRLALLQESIARHEPTLWDVARGASPERRLAAARILSRIGTAQSLPLLAELRNDPATRAVAILGLGRLTGVSDVMRLATVEPDAKLRQSLLRMLLARHTQESVRMYLDFVNEPRFQPDALAAAATMADPPVDLLLAFLESSQKSLRLAAAQALSRLPDVDIAQRLSESVFRGIGRQEALVALLLSPSAQAAGFLNQARQDLYLVASVQAAEQQLHVLTISERR